MFGSSDHQLVSRAQSGDGRAFEALHRRHFRAVWQCLYRQGFSRDDADDLAAETFVRAYRALPQFRCASGASFLPFLIRVSINLATDSWRRRQLEREAVQEEAVEGAPSVANIALQRLAREEEIAKLRRALAELPEGDREIIALCYEQDLSRAQVAEILDKPTVSAVTSHLNRALNRLRSLIEKQERQATFSAEARQVASGSDDQ